MSKRDIRATDTSEDTSRRDFLKATAATGATGALGALAGCAGGGGGGGGGNGGGGGSADVTISYLSAEAAENSLTKPHFQESVNRFGEQAGVKVNLQTTSYSDVRQKIASTVSAGNPPTLAESGGAGIDFWQDGKVPDHGQWVEGSDYPDRWSVASKATADFRGNWWSGGPLRHSVSHTGIRPKMFSQAGVSSPDELQTWSGFLDALNKVQKEFPNANAFEQTGAAADLEAYWGEARTAHTEGKDPWIRGDPKDPDVIINADSEDGKRTDGMMKNTVMLASKFSSDSTAQRSDEEIPSLMLTDRVGSFNYMTQNFTRWTTVKEDVKFGWNGGDGDVMAIPHPKLDADYGAKMGISELEGLEGEHGGHVWALEQAHSIYDVGDQKKMDAAWDLNTFLHQDDQHVLTLYGELYPAIPADTPMQDKLLEEYPDLPQNFKMVLQDLKKYGTQYNNTGGPWDVNGTDQIRWTDMNETISKAIAGQVGVDQLPQQVRQKVDKTLKERNS
ncbi:ABC transporter substrate-binding protein [Halomarina pelagica]|uniref:ABC transporter substrate-binding protein n=1 Tax=Halomarina pelagica TaxID=2961599 RepID=UPI0020C4523C|nr:ABC transporter substrate-binding protein [Halomarina sp. BND7]